MEKILQEICEKHGTLLHIKKNTVLFNADIIAEGPYVYYLVDGICALTGTSYNGQDSVLLYHTAGQMVGINPFIAGYGSGFYSYNGPVVKTKTNCTLYRIPVSIFLDYLHNNLEFSNYIVRVLSRFYHLSLAHLKQIQEDSSVTVVCRFLLSNTVEHPQGQVVPKFFTNEELSRYSGIHSVTVGRIVAKLQQLGYIRRISSGLLLENIAALKELVYNCEGFKY